MSKATPKILLIAKDSTCAELSAAGACEMVCVPSLAAGLDKINTRIFELVVFELALSDGQPLNAFSQVHAAAMQMPVIVLAAGNEEEIAARTISIGAQDYLLLAGLTPRSLAATIRKTLDRYHCQLMHNHEAFLLQTLMNNIPDAVYFKDIRSRFLMISRALAKKHHLSDPQQATGKTDADYFMAPHAQQALADEQAIMRTGQPMEGIEESETWPDGSITWVSTTKMPLRNQTGRIIGTFGVSRDITIRKQAQIALAEQTRLLHKKNQQIEDELKMARELQLAMLPHDFPSIRLAGSAEEALKFYSYYFPSGTVSGDIFDVVQLSETAVGIFICDVMGHDVRAALVTAMIRALVEDISVKTMDPGQFLTEMNQALFKVFRQAGTTMFATACYLVADVGTGELSFANAAHPCPLRLKRPSGAVEFFKIAADHKGAALGLFRESNYSTCHQTLNPEDLLVFYTDGLTEEEGANGEIFSPERLGETLAKYNTRTPQELFEQTLADIHQFSGSNEFSDDVCLLGVEVKQVRSKG